MMMKYQRQLKNIRDVIKAVIIIDVIMVVFSNALCIFYLPLLIFNSVMFSVALLRGMAITNKMNKHQHRHD